MKILLYTYTLNKNSGGALTFFIDLAKGFLDNGHKVSFLIHKISDQDIDLGIPVVVMKNNFGDLSRAYNIAKIIKLENPDVIISNMKPQNMNLAISTFFHRPSKTRYIGTVHNADSYQKYKNKNLYRKLMGKIFSRLDLLVCVSSFVQEDMAKTYYLLQNKLPVIYNGVDIQKIRDLVKEDIEEKNIFNDKKVLIHVGRLTPVKRQDLIIKAFADITNIVDDVILVFIGEGDQEKYLKQLTKDLLLETKVFFLGHKENPYKYMAKANLQIIASEFESFGLVIVEAMAVGLPTTALKSTGGHIEILEQCGGYLVSDNNTKELSDKIIEVLSAQEQISFDVNEFSIERQNQKYIELLK